MEFLKIAGLEFPSLLVRDVSIGGPARRATAPPISKQSELLDLLIKHRIGVSKKSVDCLEFDSARLSQFETEGKRVPQIP